jgi:hypothetical protein
VSDFEILQIHLTTKQAQFKLNMDVGGKSTFLANTQGGNSAGVHVLLMSTHDPDVMNLNVQTASYTENAWPSVPDRIAEVNKDAASIMLYTEDAGGGFQPGTTVHAWGVYKASGSAVLQIKDQETGEWKSLKTLRGENGQDGADYILTEEDKQEIAQEAAGLVDVPEHELPVANPDTLGGVQPAAKTDEMTNPVGVDALGGLWSSGSSSEWKLIRSDTLEQDVADVIVNIEKDWEEVFVCILGRANDAENSLNASSTKGYVTLSNGIYNTTHVVNNADIFYLRNEVVFPTTVHVRRLGEVAHAATFLYGGTMFSVASKNYWGAARWPINRIRIWFATSDMFIKAGAKVEVWSR